MWPVSLIAIYCVLIAAASMFGGWLPSRIRLTHVRMQFVMSLVSGLMIGVAFLHLLPHAAVHVKSISHIGIAMLTGVLSMFFLLRLFHIHHYEDPAFGKHSGDHCGPVHDHHYGCAHDHDHDHDGGHEHDHDAQSEPAEQPGNVESQKSHNWMGLFFGLAVHTLLDGVALAAAVAAEASRNTDLWFLGLGIFLAILFHKPLDALSITSLMQTSGWSPRSRLTVSAVFAVACPLGAILFWLGVQQLGFQFHYMVGLTLAFSAGFFLCIAMSDLLPEVAFHSHDRLKLTGALLLGVLLAFLVESMHAHNPENASDQNFRTTFSRQDL